QFDHPMGLAADEQGHIYVADSHNHAIRRIEPDGFVQTLAGGPDDTTTFTNPRALAYRTFRGKPMLLVGDVEQHCIKVIDLSDPSYPISTLAGACGEAGAADGEASSEARFSGPKSIDWGGDFQDVYMDEQGLQRRFANQGFILVTDES